MKMNNITKVFAAAILVIWVAPSHSQGFINLNFELANVPAVSTNQFGAAVPIALGMPGWSENGTPQPDQIGHNNFSLGGAYVAIEGPQWSSLQILQGSYTAYLTGSTAGTPTSAYIAQTGQIPVNSESLTFFSSPFGAPNANFQVTFGGQAISVMQLGATAKYDIMVGDVSAFAGETGELRFTAPPNTGGFLDNIQFLTTPAPEPGTCALILGGAVLFGFRRWRKG
jgi:hypothetical protein